MDRYEVDKKNETESLNFNIYNSNKNACTTDKIMCKLKMSTRLERSLDELIPIWLCECNSRNFQ